MKNYPASLRREEFQRFALRAKVAAPSRSRIHGLQIDDLWQIAEERQVRQRDWSPFLRALAEESADSADCQHTRTSHPLRALNPNEAAAWEQQLKRPPLANGTIQNSVPHEQVALPKAPPPLAEPLSARFPLTPTTPKTEPPAEPSSSRSRPSTPHALLGISSEASTAEEASPAEAEAPGMTVTIDETTCTVEMALIWPPPPAAARPTLQTPDQRVLRADTVAQGTLQYLASRHHASCRRSALLALACLLLAVLVAVHPSRVASVAPVPPPLALPPPPCRWRWSHLSCSEGCRLSLVVPNPPWRASSFRLCHARRRVRRRMRAPLLHAAMPRA